MEETLSETRAELSPYAPRITSIQIDPEKIGTVIGKGGETIRALSEEYEAQIDVDDDGTVLVYAVNGELGDACVEAIRQMTKDVELGEMFTGKVVKTTTFGAFVELTKGTDGLIHISNLKPGERRRVGRGRRQPRRRADGARGRARTRSVAGSACASPTTPRSRARRSRSCRRSAPATGSRRRPARRPGPRRAGGRGGRDRDRRRRAGGAGD